MATQDERNQGTICWILVLFIGILAPAIFLLISKERQFVYRCAIQCLTFQILVWVCGAIFGILTIVLIGFPLLIALGIFHVLFAIVGAVRANQGIVYAPPISGEFARIWFRV